MTFKEFMRVISEQPETPPPPPSSPPPGSPPPPPPPGPRPPAPTRFFGIRPGFREFGFRGMHRPMGLIRPCPDSRVRMHQVRAMNAEDAGDHGAAVEAWQDAVKAAQDLLEDLKDKLSAAKKKAKKD